ncbi:hypothetical protein NDU88_000985 [Pleurodeles waltl]|uniref:Uncharacterized protein n=1 Tax=Pleurodeles waltl TaxID=8319 RepID=A0AAV7TGI5_PLEWA|nr:hypothetical protein NDU88_000985 [Pleurodeles waltl]
MGKERVPETPASRISCPEHQIDKRNMTDTAPAHRAKKKQKNAWPGRRSAAYGEGARPALRRYAPPPSRVNSPAESGAP